MMIDRVFPALSASPRQPWLISLMASMTLITLLGVAACERQAATGPITGDSSKVVMASPGPSSSNPLVGVIPLDSTLPPMKSNSPADGTTAVGGLTSKQGSGGGATGGTPAKTSGDGK